MAGNSTEYHPLHLNPRVDLENTRALHNADLLLRDSHSMLFLPRKDIAALKSGCNYAMLIVLCSVLGGLSRTIYPRNVSSVPREDSDRRCFLQLFERMPWVSDSHNWIPRDTAAELLYDGFRNPLVHELGTDEGGKINKKPLPHEKYVVGKRGQVPSSISLTSVLNREEWDYNWAAMYYKDSNQEKVKISLVALYFLTRKLIESLTFDNELIKKNIFSLHSQGG